MKYLRLTKEQFEELHQEFAKFLATQQIDAKEWKDIKKYKPNIADEELDVFSDLVWEDVLTKTRYLEHFSKNQIDLFKCGATSIHRIVVKITKEGFNFLDETDYKWFLNNPTDSKTTYFQALKKYDKERNIELFDLIKKGSRITKGDLYKTILLQIN